MRPPPRSRRVLSLLVTLLLCAPLTFAALGVNAITSPAAADDDFYTPPSPLPAGPPGGIIRSRAVTSPTASAKAWQILYRSADAGGTPIAISGTVLVPTAAYAGDRPLIAYAAGTQGWGDQCAPSREMASKSFDEQFAVDNLLAKGWAVVVTDYPGLGTPGTELYNVGVAEGYAVLDSLRAARDLPGTGLSRTTQVAIEGYSQGGGTAGWAAQQQPAYAPDLRLVGVAAGGIPANLQAVAQNINGSPFFAFLAGTAAGFDAAYPALGMSGYLTDAGKTALQRLSGMCQTEALLTYAGKRIEDYTIGRVNPMNNADWKAVLDANNLGGTRPGAPILQYHGLLDEVIPPASEQALHRTYCSMGVATRLNFYPGDHPVTQVLAQSDVGAWIADRIAGKTPPRNC
ncbi:MAG: hypothetical protein QOE54_1758 [Streptosporangiaceae bacterium]|nr:hypothetical protein [Streptosporangiaceae bacterium]